MHVKAVRILGRTHRWISQRRNGTNYQSLEEKVTKNLSTFKYFVLKLFSAGGEFSGPEPLESQVNFPSRSWYTLRGFQSVCVFVPKMNSVYSSYVKMPRYGSLVATGKKDELQALLKNHDYRRFTVWMPERMNLRNPHGTGPQPHTYPH